MRWEDLDINSEKLAGYLASFCFASRKAIAPYFRQPLVVEGKADNSPVTVADKSAEAVIRQALHDIFPEHNVVGEEHGGQITGEIDWVIDPIDGTRAFVMGKPTFGTLVALRINHKAVASVIDMPMLDEMFIAVPNHTSTLNGHQIFTSDVTDLNQARICSTAPEALDEKALPKYMALSSQCLSSNWGGDCYNYALLAAGHIDIVIEHQLASHDIMALVPVIENAGGVVTDWQGDEVVLGVTSSLIACANKDLHAQVIEAMR